MRIGLAGAVSPLLDIGEIERVVGLGLAQMVHNDNCDAVLGGEIAFFGQFRLDGRRLSQARPRARVTGYGGRGGGGGDAG